MNPTFEGTPATRRWEIAALVHAAADTLAARFGQVRVRGEVSAFSQAGSGHCYFSLKDASGAQAMLRCAMFRRAAVAVRGLLRDGVLVEAWGRLAIYEPRGDLQFVVEGVQPVGAGALHEEFLRLKARLEAQGLFDAARKRRLPVFPRTVGIITSLGAAALRDIVSTFARRAPHVQLLLFPSLVQGAEAPASLLQALAAAVRHPGLDAIIIARGGGSLEDLWCFNDERLVRALAEVPVPVVSGVGHETDFTLCDFASDVRAATPTAAAELLAPDAQDQLDLLGQWQDRMAQAARWQLERQEQRLQRLAFQVLRPARGLSTLRSHLESQRQRLQAALERRLQSGQRQLDGAAHRLQASVRAPLVRASARLEASAQRLQAQDPRAVLGRGYAWVEGVQGETVTGSAQLVAGQGVRIVWMDGSAQARIESIQPTVP